MKTSIVECHHMPDIEDDLLTVIDVNGLLIHKVVLAREKKLMASCYEKFILALNLL